MGSRRRWWTLRAMSVLLAFVWLSGIVSAHGVQASRFESPVPFWFVMTGGGLVVAFTAVFLAAGDDYRFRFETVELLTIPQRSWTHVRNAARILFLALVGAALVHGAFGPQAPAENIATVFTWPVWLHGLAVLAVLFGNPWRVLSPWRTIHYALSWLEGQPLALWNGPPRWMGHWPAVLGFVLVVGIVENLTVIPRSPQLTVVLVAVYALTMIGGSVIWGRHWLHQADPLEVLYRLLGRVAPVTTGTTATGDTKVSLRPPWSGLAVSAADRSVVVFVIATVYTVSFDGFTNTTIYQSLRFDLRTLTGVGPLAGVVYYLGGLVAFVAVFAAISWVIDRIGSPTTPNWSETATRVAPTILPIAAAYELAHNTAYVIRNTDQLLSLLLPGVESLRLLEWLSVELYWTTQVTLITVGHIVAVVAAHHVLADRYPTPHRTIRAHLPLVALMIGYTILSLWIISQPILT